MAKRGRQRIITAHVARKIFLMSGYGMTDEQISEILGFERHTITRAKEDVQFSTTLKGIKDKTDLAVVNALYMRATGYDYEEEAIAKKGFEYDIVTIKKHALPDVMACMYWLNNRDRMNWKQKPPVTEEDSEAEKKNARTLVQIFRPIREKEVSRISAGEDPMKVLFSSQFIEKMEKKKRGSDNGSAPSASNGRT